MKHVDSAVDVAQDHLDNKDCLNHDRFQSLTPVQARVDQSLDEGGPLRLGTPRPPGNQGKATLTHASSQVVQGIQSKTALQVAHERIRILAAEAEQQFYYFEPH